MATTIYGTLPARPQKKQTPSLGWQKIFGLTFPIGSKTNSGYFNKESGIELIKNNLKQILLTERGERVMLPNFGANLRRYLFEPLDSKTLINIREEVLLALKRYAPYVQVLKLRIEPLDKFGVESLQAIKIFLTLKLTELDNIIIDTNVEIG